MGCRRSFHPSIRPKSDREPILIHPRDGRAIGASVADVNARYGADSEFAQYHANLLNSHLPDGLADAAEVADASADFESLWKDFGL